MAEVFKVARKGYDASSAQDANLLVNSKYPFIKLDTDSSVSFQTIVFTFNTDPPEPVLPSTSQDTTVYSFPHGYNYKPSFWALIQTLAPIPATHFYQAYFQSSGVVSAYTSSDSASFTVTADNQNIYFTVTKFDLQDGVGQPNPLTGLVLQIRLYVFVDDIGI